MASSGKKTAAAASSAVDINHQKRKTTQGKKKIEIKKIAQESSRQVTFSKRRSGLFKKASELCILTGAEIAIIIVSNAKRVYAFGHPSPGAVIDRYVAGESSPVSPPSAEVFVKQERQYAELCQLLEAEKKKTEDLEVKKMADATGNEPWWDAAVDEMGLEELEEHMAALEELRKKVLMSADKLAQSRMGKIDLNLNQNPNQDNKNNNNNVGGSSDPDDFLMLDLNQALKNHDE